MTAPGIGIKKAALRPRQSPCERTLAEAGGEAVRPAGQQAGAKASGRRSGQVANRGKGFNHGERSTRVAGVVPEPARNFPASLTNRRSRKPKTPSTAPRAACHASVVLVETENGDQQPLPKSATDDGCKTWQKGALAGCRAEC